MKLFNLIMKLPLTHVSIKSKTFEILDETFFENITVILVDNIQKFIMFRDCMSIVTFLETI
jgi:hypothetical protein